MYLEIKFQLSLKVKFTLSVKDTVKLGGDFKDAGLRESDSAAHLYCPQAVVLRLQDASESPGGLLITDLWVSP